MIYKDPTLQRVFILESETLIGVRLVPLSKYLKDYHGKDRPYKGNIVVARVTPRIDEDKLNRAISYGMDELTKPYDNFEIMRIGFRILFRISRRTRDRKYICSALVYDCFDQIGVPFNLRDEYVGPDDVWRDDQVEPQYRIMRFLTSAAGQEPTRGYLPQTGRSDTFSREQQSGLAAAQFGLELLAHHCPIGPPTFCAAAEASGAHDL